MGKLRVSRIENATTTDGGIDIDTSGHVQVDGVQMPTAGPLSNRNLIINGAMQVWQRATSHTGSGGGYFTADRWRYTQSSGYGAEVSPVMTQDTDVPNNSFAYSFKLETTTGEAPDADQYIELDTYLEGQDVCRLAQGTNDATGMTLSFWVKASIAGTYCVVIGSVEPYVSGRKYVAEYSISSSNTWEHIVIPIPGDTSGTWDKTTNGIGLSVGFTVASGSDKQGTANAWLNASQITNTSNQTNLTATAGSTWFITGVQLEVGEKATPFEHRSFGDELQRCQRYYYRINGSDTAGGTGIFGNGFSQTSSGGRASVPYPVTMRVAPSALEQSGTANHYKVVLGSSGATTCSAVPTHNSPSVSMGDIFWTVASGATLNQGVYFASNNASSYLGWSAEL